MDRLIKLVLVFAIALGMANLPGCADNGDDVATSNQPPIANSGSNQTVTLVLGQNTTTVTLQGSASDADGTIASYSWSGTPKPADLQNPSVTLGVGTYTFTLIATDNQGAQSSASTVTITVNAAQPPPSKAVIVFSTSLPTGSTERIGSVDITIELPNGVTLPTGAGAVSTGVGGVLNLSGEGALFAALPNASTAIIGNYTPVTATSKASVTMSVITLTSDGQGMNQGEFATLVCDLTPGVTVDLATFTPMTSVLIGNATGVKLYDSLTGITGPASATFIVTLQ